MMFLGCLLLLCQAKQGSAVNLQLNVKKDERYEYTTTFLMESEDPVGSVHVTMQLGMRIAGVSDDKVTISHFVPRVTVRSDGSLKTASNQFESMRGSQYSREVDRFGRDIQGETVDTKPATADLVFAGHSVREGDSWEGSMIVSAKPIRTKYRFDGTAILGGRIVYRITRFIQPDQAISDVDPTVFWVAKSDGMMVRSMGKFKGEADGRIYFVTLKVQRMEKNASKS